MRKRSENALLFEVKLSSPTEAMSLSQFHTGLFANEVPGEGPSSEQYDIADLPERGQAKCQKVRP